MTTPNPSPTEEELALFSILAERHAPKDHDCETALSSSRTCERGVRFCLRQHDVEDLLSSVPRLILALRSARESARVATRERDELVTERESWGDYSKHLETQLTDRDQMIAGLREALQSVVDHYTDCDCHLNGWCERRGKARLAALTSHPIAAAFEARKEKL